MFSKSFTILFVSLSCWGVSAHELANNFHVHDGKKILEANDAGEVIYEEIHNEGEGLDISADHKYFHFKRSFEQVTSYLTPKVESSFDTFILVNVKYQKWGEPDDYLPPQRMQVLRRAYAGQNIFTRDGDSVVNGVNVEALGATDENPALEGFPALIKVSTGAGGRAPDPQPYVDTFSGMFRMNHTKSEAKPHQQGMIWSMFVDVKYSSGKMSGIAIHGTPSANYAKLGTQQSHGCVRIRQKYSKPLYHFLLSDEIYEQDLVTFNNRERLGPLLRDDNGDYVTRPGQKVLMIFFYGYDGQQGLSI